MTFRIPLSKLIVLTKQFTFVKDGDLKEKQYGFMAFPKCEEFWKLIVTPLTNRITGGGEFIRVRENVTEDLQEIAAYHYSIFLNIVYADDCLKGKQIAYFENFYAHISTACDLVEELLLKIYLLINECKGEPLSYRDKLNESQFMDIARHYFEERYADDYEYFFSKGKHKSIVLINNINILNELFKDFKAWDEYNKLTIKYRTYRNIVLHNKQLAFWKIEGKDFVPKTNYILKYKTWNNVFSATEETIKNEFIERKELMKQTLDDFKACLEKLWEKPLSDLYTLLYTEKNHNLLFKYDLQFIDDIDSTDFLFSNPDFGNLDVSGSTNGTKKSSL